MRETTNRQTRPIHNLISHYSRRALTAVVLTACALVLSAANAAADQSGSQETRIAAALSGAGIGGVTPKGEAEFRQRADGRRSLEVEVEHVNLPAGTVLGVLVDNQMIGTITLGAFQSGQIELETENGQTFLVINSRTRVVVTNHAGGTIVAGSFGDITPTPTPNAEVRIEARLAGAAINGLTPTGHA